MSALLICIIAIVYYDVPNENKTIQKYEKNISNRFPNINTLEAGDIIFRRSYGLDSTISTNFSNTEKRYSHAGIIVMKNNNYFVMHSQEDSAKNRNGIFSESLEDFLSGIETWAIYRYPIDKSSLNLFALELERNHIIFDNKFDLETDDAMYCSEFIYKIINKTAKRKLIQANKKFMGRLFVTISNLYETKTAKLVQYSHKKIVTTRI